MLKRKERKKGETTQNEKPRVEQKKVCQYQKELQEELEINLRVLFNKSCQDISKLQMQDPAFS